MHVHVPDTAPSKEQPFPLYRGKVGPPQAKSFCKLIAYKMELAKTNLN